jgi:2-phosphosulfolactate phosphatase
MIRIDAILHPCELTALRDSDLENTVCVVFDVLRATSSIVTALAHGVKAVRPAESIDEARALKKRFPHALLGGERRGRRIEGFDLGNSPLEYQSLAGREVITTTTNGTVALRACDHAARVFPGALLNVDYLAEVLGALAPENLLLVCAGSGSRFSLEDAIGAGALVDRLQGKGIELSDAARAACGIYLNHREAVEDVFRHTRNGKALAEIGKKADIAWCARFACFRVAPSMRNGVIRPDESAVVEKVH